MIMRMMNYKMSVFPMDDLLTEGKIILALRAGLIVVFGIDSAVSKIRKRTREDVFLCWPSPLIQIPFAKPAQTGIIIR